MASLATRDIQDAGTGRESQEFNKSRDLPTVFPSIKDRLELHQVVFREIGRPPLRLRSTGSTRGSACFPCRALLDAPQKNTGSRYAPNFFSSA